MRTSFPYLLLPKRPLSHLQIGQGENILGRSNLSLLNCFENSQGVLYSDRESRKEMMNTFMLVNIIPPHIRNSLEDKSMLASSRKRPCFSMQFCQEENILELPFGRRAYCFNLKAIRIFPIPTSRVKRGWWTPC